MVWGIPVRSGVSEGVGGVRRWQLARLALLGRVVVHSVELNLIPLLHNKGKMLTLVIVITIMITMTTTVITVFALSGPWTS